MAVNVSGMVYSSYREGGRASPLISNFHLQVFGTVDGRDGGGQNFTWHSMIITPQRDSPKYFGAKFSTWGYPTGAVQGSIPDSKLYLDVRHA